MNHEFEYAAKALKLIERLHFMNLATASKKAIPLNSPVFFAYDGRYFYWMSEPSAQHSINIHDNPDVSIVIFDSTKSDRNSFGVYFNAKAERILDTDISSMQTASDALCEKSGKPAINAHLHMHKHPRRFFRAKPTAAWVNGTKSQDGFKVDTRESIRLSLLKPQ